MRSRKLSNGFGRRIPIATSAAEEEADVRVPLIGEKGNESLDAAATDALAAAAEAAVRAEAQNPIDLENPQHFSTKGAHAEP